MGTAQSKDEDCTDEKFQETYRLIEEQGVVGAQDAFRKELEEWRDVEIKIGVTGNAGVGKSSFINTIRGIGDEEKKSAITDVVEVKSGPTPYSYDNNEKITLMDLPGIGTITYPNLETYCEKVGLETYDTFLILTASRFTQLELDLAQKIKSMGKSFFLIRTKIDVDERSDKRKKSHKIEDMLTRIRADCYENVKNLGIREDEIFIISNHEKDKWEFNRLVDAILDKLSTHQKEALTLTLKADCKQIVRRKVEVLRSRIWKVVLLFIPAVPLDLLSGNLVSHTINWAEVKRRTKIYRSRLGLPEEDSDEFKEMKPEFQEELKKLCPKDNSFWTKYLGCALKLPVIFCVKSAIETKNSLGRLLGDMEELSLKILDDAATRTEEDMD